MHDLIASRFDAVRGAGSTPLAWSALPDAPVERIAEVAPPAWRVALAAAMRRAAARLDRPVAVPAPAC